MAAPLLNTIVSVNTYPGGMAVIHVAGPGGVLNLQVFPDGPKIAFLDPLRRDRALKALVAVEANGKLRGYFVAKKGETPQGDTLVWFPARKKRVKKPTKQARKA